MSTTSALAGLATDANPFGESLRAWRDARKVSQLELALEARVSQRHVSFLESGRAQPSREMVLQLARALDVPLRESNLLLKSAGFAPLYHERTLDSEEMSVVRQALEMTMAHHEPYPAMVINRSWGMVLRNHATDRLLGMFGDAEALWARIDPSGEHNTLRLTFHPDGMQPLLRNWEEVATLLLSRLQREVASDPANTRLRAVFEEITAYPGIPPRWRSACRTSPPPPILPLELVLGDDTLKLFTMLSTFSTAQDVTADELRLETFFPADDFSAAFFRRLAAG